MVITEKDPAAMLTIIASEQDKRNPGGRTYTLGVYLDTNNHAFALKALRTLVIQGKVRIFSIRNGNCVAIDNDFDGE